MTPSKLIYEKFSSQNEKVVLFFSCPIGLFFFYLDPYNWGQVVKMGEKYKKKGNILVFYEISIF